MGEKNTNYVLKICVRGTSFDIEEYVAKSIPFLKILFEQNTNDIIELNSISPCFLTLLIGHLINKKKVICLKKLLEEDFEKDDIVIFLKYLGMHELLDKIYNPVSTIDGKIIIVSCGVDKWKDNNGKIFDRKDIDNREYIHILNEIILEETDNSICVVRQRDLYDSIIGRKNIFFFRQYISKLHLLKHMNSFYVDMNTYFKLNDLWYSIGIY